MDKIKVLIRNSQYEDSKEITILLVEEKGRTAVLNEIKDGMANLKFLKEGDIVQYPTLKMDNNLFKSFATSMLEALTGETQDIREGKLHATQEHLKDMRIIAFHKLGIK